MTAPLRPKFGWLLVAAMVVWLVPWAVAAAAPADFAAQVSALAEGGFQEKIEAVGALAGSGDERAEPVLTAMVEGRLYVRRADGKVLIGREQGSVVVLTDPVAGTEIGQLPATDLDSITVNNRLRGVLRGALGSLTLASRDPGRRAAAADAMFRTRDPQQLPLLEQALARETDAGARDRMERTLAAIILTSDRPADERVAAAKTLDRFADREVASLLANVLAGNPEPAVADAVQASLGRIEDSLAVWSAVGNLFQGISLGSVLLLAAVGLAITFGVMGVINMAHGELVMVGAYVTFVVQEWFRTNAPGSLDLALAIAVPLAFVVTALVGIVIERGIIRFLYGRPLETLLATWGLSLILQQAVRTLFGPTNREVSNPSWMSGAIEVVGGLTLTYNRIWIIVFSLVVFFGLMLLIRATSFGLRMRAVTQNRRMAASMGIPTGRIDALTFGLGSGIAGIAGVALSQIDNVSPNLGQGYIIDSFMVVVFGGVGNLWGTLIGAFSLGIVNKLLEPYAGAVLGKIFILVAIILFIQRRPRGLFALKGRAVEQ
ncbi:MAG: urea ABC transporter permease subunit UrtB [Rhodospirillales bacterium]